MKCNGRFCMLTILAMVLGMTAWAAPVATPQGVSPGAADRTTGTPGRCPTFIWETVEGAASYDLVVYELTECLDQGAEFELTVDLEYFHTTVSGRTNSWTPELARCFSPGGSYVWFVRAVLGEAGYPEVTEWSDGLLFAVASAPTTDEVIRALEVLRRYVGDESTDLEGFENIDDEPTYKTGSDARRRRSTARGEPKAGSRSVTTGTAAIRGEMPDPSGETYGVVGTSNSPGGAGLAAANTAGGVDLVLDGSADLQTDTELRQSGIDRPLASAQTFNIQNSGGGGMTLLVDGVETVTTATDSDTLGGLTCGGNEVAKWNGSAWVCAPDDDADTLGGLTCGGSEVAKWNGSAWVCAPDFDTDTLGGLACPNGQVAKRNGTVWTCAPDDDTLAGMSCALGQVAKQGFGSTWACAQDNDTTYSFGPGLSVDNGQIVIDPSAFSTRISRLAADASSTSLAIGADGLGLISYYYATSSDLKVAHCENIACTTATISTLDSTDSVGEFTSLAIGSDGLGLISYYDDTNSNLKVAHCDNLACTSATVTALDLWGSVGAYPSVAIGTDGLGLISYFDDSNDSLKVAHCHNVACTSATLRTVDSSVYVGPYTSIAIGADGLGLISYLQYLTVDLKVAHCDDIPCTSATISTLDSSNSVGWNTSVAIGTDGLGLITYFDEFQDDLKVAHCDDVACTSATVTAVDDAGILRGNRSVVIAGDGLGLISYHDDNTEDLKVAHCNDLPCTSATIRLVDGTGDVGRESSVAIGVDGRGLISYRDTTTGDLKVAHLPIGY